MLVSELASMAAPARREICVWPSFSQGAGRGQRSWRREGGRKDANTIEDDMYRQKKPEMGRTCQVVDLRLALLLARHVLGQGGEALLGGSSRGGEAQQLGQRVPVVLRQGAGGRRAKSLSQAVKGAAAAAPPPCRACSRDSRRAYSMSRSPRQERRVPERRRGRLLSVSNRN